MIISPERFLGGRMSGAVREAGAGMLRVGFDRLEFRGRRYGIDAAVERFVNSKGHPFVDEDERAVTVEDGVMRSAHEDFPIDEGAELRLDVQPR